MQSSHALASRRPRSANARTELPGLEIAGRNPVKFDNAVACQILGREIVGEDETFDLAAALFELPSDPDLGFVVWAKRDLLEVAAHGASCTDMILSLLT